MEKKELKWYETPAMEIVELNAKVSLLAGSDEPDTGFGDWTEPSEER